VTFFTVVKKVSGGRDLLLIEYLVLLLTILTIIDAVFAIHGTWGIMANLIATIGWISMIVEVHATIQNAG